MADILIRGMEMPKNEPLTITITPEGKVFRAFIPGSCGEVVPLPEEYKKLGDTIDAIAQKVYAALDALDRGTDNDWARAALEEANQILDVYYKKEVSDNG